MGRCTTRAWIDAVIIFIISFHQGHTRDLRQPSYRHSMNAIHRFAGFMPRVHDRHSFSDTVQLSRRSQAHIRTHACKSICATNIGIVPGSDFCWTRTCLERLLKDNYYHERYHRLLWGRETMIESSYVQQQVQIMFSCLTTWSRAM